MGPFIVPGSIVHIHFFFVLQKENDTDNKVEILSHWHPNLTINLVDDHTPWVEGSVPAPLDECK